MKKFFILSTFCLCAAGFFNNLYAENVSNVCSEKDGKFYCGVGQIDGFTHLGDTVLNGTTVTGSIRIIGDTEIHNAQIYEMSIVGDVTATDSDVSGEAGITGDTTLTNMRFKDKTKIVGDDQITNAEFATNATIIGRAEITGTNFRGPLTLASSKATLSHSTSSSITFSDSRNDQNLYLNQNSRVNGDISFPSSNGTIYLASDSRINGKVNGGKIINN
jgi:hypothetical protein